MCFYFDLFLSNPLCQLHLITVFADLYFQKNIYVYTYAFICIYICVCVLYRYLHSLYKLYQLCGYDCFIRPSILFYEKCWRNRTIFSTRDHRYFYSNKLVYSYLKSIGLFAMTKEITETE